MFSQAGIAALSAKLLPRITFGFATADAAAPSSVHGLPTLDQLGTGWLDCGWSSEVYQSRETGLMLEIES
jgi:hypothetical protein